MSRALSKPAVGMAEESEGGAPIEQCMLVQQEIWRIVSEAARTGSRVALKTEAQRIATSYPATSFTADSIADAIVYAAVDCGVAFERRKLSRPTVEVPSILALVGKRRRQRTEEKHTKSRPTFAGVPIPAAI